jgi:hypothetical protein
MKRISWIVFLILMLTGPSAWADVKIIGGSGSGTPGGSANQLQYNSAGTALGGFTMSGDCTIVVATGVITCVSVNGVKITRGATAAQPVTAAVGDIFIDTTLDQLEMCTNATGPVWTAIYTYAADGSRYIGAYNTAADPTCNAASDGMMQTEGAGRTLKVCINGTGWITYIKTTDFGENVLTALGIAIGTAGAPVVLNGVGGTPSSITLTNGTGLPTTGLVGHAVTTTGLTAGRAYYVSAADTYTAADATSAATLPSPAVCVAISTTVCQFSGTYTTTGLTAGAIYYVPVGGGAITATAPSASNNQIQRIGVARSTTVLQILPSLTVDTVL